VFDEKTSCTSKHQKSHQHRHIADDIVHRNSALRLRDRPTLCQTAPPLLLQVRLLLTSSCILFRLYNQDTDSNRHQRWATATTSSTGATTAAAVWATLWAVATICWVVVWVALNQQRMSLNPQWTMQRWCCVVFSGCVQTILETTA
jgi:hypothetical protein